LSDRKCSVEEEYSNTTMPLTYKTIYMNIFLKLTPAPKEWMSYVLSDNFIYNIKCNTNTVINNSIYLVFGSDKMVDDVRA